MFKFFKSKEDKFNQFVNDIQLKDLKCFALNISNTMSAMWDFPDTKLALEIKENKITFTQGDRNTFTTPIDEFKQKVLLLIQQSLLYQFESSKEQIHRFPNITTPQEGELKGEEWIKVTSKVLKESYLKASKEDNLIVEGSVFIGMINSSEFSIRFQSYNLDYNYIFKDSGLLNIHIYDDKNKQRGSSKEASYIGEFRNNRHILLDELLQVISELIKKSEFRIFS
ncbi:hypothetical protein [Halobacteriovorax sp. HLS]|uniref:hypothetical protein n=1 Tax=Halobacteriovorax sp. HLS TaxID=2234000 RepID=UPI000FD888A2|nr:hypothetical protein [Halobacteriovorax sp. HLS]